MYKNRSRIVLIVFFMCILILTLRIFYFQILNSSNLSKSASAQRIAEFKIEKPRGNILDRNGMTFTNRTKKILILLKPLLLNDKEEELRKVCSVLGLYYFDIKRQIEINKQPIVFEIDEQKKNSIMNSKIEGVSIINSLKRYDSNSIARHVTGYLSAFEQLGQTGIEKAYEDVLTFDKQSSVGLIKDAKDNPLQGLGYRFLNSQGKDKELNVRLTLDYHIQKIAEDAMNKALVGDKNVKGAVVVEDVNSGNILAMVSKPDFDQNNIDKYLSSPQKELFNKAVAAYNVGSIFKIVDIAEAFETKVVPEEKFFCPGFIKVGGKIFKCSSYNIGGHGTLNSDQAFAFSCNPYFINMGIKLGFKNIIEMAKKFGFGSFTGIRNQGITEANGVVPDENRFYSDGDIANISIGQGEIMATPLQVADFIATVANGGIKNKLNIVESIDGDDGNKIREITEKAGTRIISKETAEKIKLLMEEVVTTGSGKKANLDQYGGSAGKTGSAEAGIDANGEKIVHAWFAGYFPVKNPKYSISVFIENGKLGGEVAAPIFKEIAQEIMKKGF